MMRESRTAPMGYRKRVVTRDLESKEKDKMGLAADVPNIRSTRVLLRKGCRSIGSFWRMTMV